MNDSMPDFTAFWLETQRLMAAYERGRLAEAEGESEPESEVEIDEWT